MTVISQSNWRCVLLPLPVPRLKRHVYFTVSPRCGRRAGMWYLHVSCRASTLGARSRTADCRATYVHKRGRRCLHREYYVERTRRVSAHAAYNKRSRPDSRTARPRVRDGFWTEREIESNRKDLCQNLCAFPVLTHLPSSRVASQLPLGTPSTVACHCCTSCCNKSRHVWEFRVRA